MTESGCGFINMLATIHAQPGLSRSGPDRGSVPARLRAPKSRSLTGNCGNGRNPAQLLSYTVWITTASATTATMTDPMGGTKR